MHADNYRLYIADIEPPMMGGSICLHSQFIDYLMQQINEILAFNLYTTVKPPEEYSLKIINNTYLYIKKLLKEQTPLINDYKKYSIFDKSCWGNF